MAEHDDLGGPQHYPITNTAAILAMLADNSPKDEPYHERDCPACDVASEVVGALAVENWWTVPAVGWPGGLTMAQQAEKVVAHVLHRRMPGHSGGRR